MADMIYNTGALDLNEGDTVPLQSDADGNLKVVVSGSPALPSGAATSAKQDTGNASLASIDTKMSDLKTYTDGLEGLVTTTNSTLTTLGGYVDTLETLVTATNGYVDGLETKLAGGLPVELGAGGGLKVDGSGTALPVSGPITNTQFIAALQSTPVFSTVNSANSSTQLLAANASRKGLIIINTDANALYIDISGGTAATTRYTKKLAQDEQWECPYAPVTAITGIWAADGSGAALITELS